MGLSGYLASLGGWLTASATPGGPSADDPIGVGANPPAAVTEAAAPDHRPENPPGKPMPAPGKTPTRVARAGSLSEELQALREAGITRMASPSSRHQVRWFRPPCGRMNEAMTRNLRRLGYKIAMGDVFGLDTHIRDPEYIAQHHADNARRPPSLSHVSSSCSSHRAPLL